VLTPLWLCLFAVNHPKQKAGVAKEPVGLISENAQRATLLKVKRQFLHGI
jgi:hypothetical protein